MSSSEDRRHARSRAGGEGKPTDDAARAVRGELVEHDEQSKQTRRVWYRLEQVEIKWLPVSEASFLLWVLVALLVVWLAIGVALGLV